MLETTRLFEDSPRNTCNMNRPGPKTRRIHVATKHRGAIRSYLVPPFLFCSLREYPSLAHLIESRIQIRTTRKINKRSLNKAWNQYRQSEKLETFSQMWGSHDFLSEKFPRKLIRRVLILCCSKVARTNTAQTRARTKRFPNVTS